ncbi:MAG TPA: hypothetical protein VF505_02205 [Thermoanaerobaculia bacterium]
MTLIAAALIVRQLAAIERHFGKDIADAKPQCVVLQQKPDANTFVCVAEDLSEGGFSSEIRLYRVSNGGVVRLLSRAEQGGWRPAGISLVNVLHSGLPQILVTWCCARSQPASLYQVRGTEIEEILDDSLYWDFITFDDDGDGIDEILSTGCCDIRECSTGVMMSIMKSHGSAYAAEELEIVDGNVFVAGNDGRDRPLALQQARDRTSDEFVLHIVNGGRPGDRIRKATVRIDGKVVPGLNVTEKTRTLDRKILLDTSCHTINGHVEGPEGAKLWVFVTKP